MSYIDGFVAAVPSDNKEAYRAYAEKIWPIFQGLGAVAMWDCWGDDVPDGEVTSLLMAVHANEDESVVFAWTVWPDKKTRDAGWAKMAEDTQLQADMDGMPFDGKRMIFGGFAPLTVCGTMPNT